MNDDMIVVSRDEDVLWLRLPTHTEEGNRWSDLRQSRTHHKTSQQNDTVTRGS